MDIRRIVFTARSPEERRPWQHKRFRRTASLAIFSSLLLSLTLVQASQATGTPARDARLASFVQRDLRRALATVPTAATIPATVPVAAAVPPPAPAANPTPAPAPTPPPAAGVDGSSAAAWAASPGVACIRDHESGDDYGTNTGNGYYGAYQDSLSTWESNGGTGLPSDAPPEVQDQINYQIWLSGGWGQWGTAAGCGL